MGSGTVSASILNLNVDTGSAGASASSPLNANASTVNALGASNTSGNAFINDSLSAVQVGDNVTGVAIGTFNLNDSLPSNIVTVGGASVTLNVNNMALSTAGTLKINTGGTLSVAQDGSGNGGLLTINAGSLPSPT